MSEIDRARTQRDAVESVAGRKAVGTERSYDTLRRYLGAEIYAEWRRPAPVSAPHQAVTSGTTEPAGQPAAVRVRPIGGHGYEIAVRGHRVVVDQPVDAGGEDRGAQPLELFVAALAACVATYAGSYLRRHGIDGAGLSVSCDYDLAADRPARIGSIRVLVRLPEGVPAERRAPLLAMARYCTAHNTLRTPPQVDIELA
jgi:uncharacterized OsmC-like protein